MTTSTMQQFHKIAQAYPELRDAALRKQDSREIYHDYSPGEAATQSSRCLQCGVPFCQIHCPLGNNIPDWLKLTAEQRLEEAYAVSSATNTFPEICGRICPQDRLCEGSCVTEQSGFGAITIGSVEKFITDHAWKEGWVQPFPPSAENGLSVGIIGAGPAGLAAAEQLRRQGYAVHIYDRYDRVGGLMIYGIPSFKLDKTIVLRRHQQYADSGIIFHLGADVGGESLPFADLREKHDALLIATGVYKARPLGGLKGSELSGVVDSLPYLTASNKTGLGDSVAAYEDGALNASGKKVVVIGGGDTAMDCVRTATRQGAASVTCLYRRDRANMPGSAREVKHAESEGVHFEWLSAPVAFNGSERVESLRIQKMRLSAPDKAGRQQPVPVEGQQEVLGADMVIAALGFEAEDLPGMFGQQQLSTGWSGTLKVDENLQTALPGVYAAGDIVRGASLVVWAIVDGRRAAAAIHQQLQAKKSPGKGL